MSDQDFFFDDEDEAPKDTQAPSKQAAPAKKQASQPAGKGGNRPAPVTPSSSGGQIFEQNVTLAVAALLMVIALLVGVIIGIFVGGAISSTPSQSATTGTGTTTAPSSGGTGADPLTQDQMSGGLPAGHPDIGGATGTTTP